MAVIFIKSPCTTAGSGGHSVPRAVPTPSPRPPRGRRGRTAACVSTPSFSAPEPPPPETERNGKERWAGPVPGVLGAPTPVTPVRRGKISLRSAQVFPLLTASSLSGAGVPWMRLQRTVTLLCEAMMLRGSQHLLRKEQCGRRPETVWIWPWVMPPSLNVVRVLYVTVLCCLLIGSMRLSPDFHHGGSEDSKH